MTRSALVRHCDRFKKSKEINANPQESANKNFDTVNIRLTFPSSSIPLLLNLVPALRHDNREINVNKEGNPLLGILIGADELGTVIVRTNPRITEVRIREASSSALSWSSNSERNLTSGPIIYEFHRNDSSRLSMSNVVASADLEVHVRKTVWPYEEDGKRAGPEVY
jgi:hypothetical protein